MSLMDVYSLSEPFISVSGQIINISAIKESKISISKGIVYLIFNNMDKTKQYSQHIQHIQHKNLTMG